MKCSIVLATYNRKELFERTLKCVAEADYSGCSDIDLIISIDRAENCNEMKKVADDFVWKYGNKHVILHEARKGLRQHFIFCGSLSQEYGPVIFIEDDVVVNKYYYKTAQQMTDYYINDDRIVGVSLYSLAYNETAQRPFIPMKDGSDVFFCELMSWAPVYFPKQWRNFLNWLDLNDGQEMIYQNVPPNVQNWKTSSFKKLHIQYMAQNKLYFAYCRNSCATNFSEPGEHYKKNSNVLQVPMEIAYNDKLKMISIDDSFAVYDTFMELSPDVVKKFSSVLKNYSFDMDLYGKKELINIEKDYVLTSRKTIDSVMSFGCKMQPLDLNLFWNIEGSEFCLSKKENVKFGSKGIKKYLSDVIYDIKGANVLKIIISDIIWAFSAFKARIKFKKK